MSVSMSLITTTNSVSHQTKCAWHYLYVFFSSSPNNQDTDPYDELLDKLKLKFRFLFPFPFVAVVPTFSMQETYTLHKLN
jgi:hypothetical protein